MSPFLVFFSTEARPYALVMALCLVVVAGAAAGGRGGPAHAGGCCTRPSTCAAMYTHYTGDLRPRRRRPPWALAAHPGAVAPARARPPPGPAVAYLPWLPSYFRTDQVTHPARALISVLLQPFERRRGRATDVLQLVDRAPGGRDRSPTMPGRPAVALVAAGLLAGTAGTAVAAAVARARPPVRAGGERHPGRSMVVLALATPVLAAAIQRRGRERVPAAQPDRLVAGAGAADGRPWPQALDAALDAGCPATAMVLAGLRRSARPRSCPSSAHRPDYDGVARFIDDRDRGGAVVVDAPGLTAGPLSLLDVALARRGDRRPVPRLNRAPRDVQLSAFRPGGPGQYASLPVPSAASVARRTQRASPDTLFLVSPGAISLRRLTGREGSRRTRAEFAASGQAMFIRALPGRLRYRGMRTFPGLFGRQPVSVYVFEDWP